MNRRDFVRVGGLGVAGITLPWILRNEATAAETHTRPKSVIYVVLDGGPSHIDMWDPKPDSPDEIRGPFKPIATKLPGVQFTELMPMQAEMMDRLALLRGIRSVENDHFLSEVYTGLPRTSGKRPAFGSVVSRVAGTGSPLPTYVSLDRPTTDEFEFEKPHYAGSGHGPFRPFGDALEDLRPIKSNDRLQDRKRLLRDFDGLSRELERQRGFDSLDRYQAQALEIMTSPKVRDAFDLSKESDRLRALYGDRAGKYTHQT